MAWRSREKPVIRQRPAGRDEGRSGAVHSAADRHSVTTIPHILPLHRKKTKRIRKNTSLQDQEETDTKAKDLIREKCNVTVILL